MKTIKFNSWAVAIAAAITLGATAFAASNASPAGIRPRREILSKLTSLGVTPQQKEQIRAILRETQPTRQPLLQRFVQERRTLRSLIQANPTDEQAIRAEVSKLSGIGADLAVQRARTFSRIRAVLTPEQVEKLKSLEASVDAAVDDGLDRFAQWVSEG
jgi:Spy/CpxP family protein refolding chaperone